MDSRLAPVGTPKNYLLDTNVLVHDANSLFSFEDNHVYILVSVLQELDRLKNSAGEIGANARRAARHLDGLREHGRLSEGVSLDTGGKVFVVPHMRDGLDLDMSQVDNQLLTTARKLGETTSWKSVVVTKDVNLRVRADGVGVVAEDYRNDKLNGLDYRGFGDLVLPRADIDRLYAEKSISCPSEMFSNFYVRLVSEEDPKHTGLGRVKGDRIVLLESGHGVIGIKGRNVAQCFAIHALLDEAIGVVSLRGKAGTGKTLLAIAAGLSQVLCDDSRYQRVTITRPTIPVGNDLGFLPGTLDEKMLPWMRPVYDALDTIAECDARSGKSRLPAGPELNKIVDAAPLAYVRGRSIAGSFMIVDEAQNMTPHEVKTLITRAGLNTKVVLTGDVDQIDNPYLDATSNGFSYLISKFRGQDIFAHIELMRGERSKVAELAATVL